MRGVGTEHLQLNLPAIFTDVGAFFSDLQQMGTYGTSRALRSFADEAHSQAAWSTANSRTRALRAFLSRHSSPCPAPTAHFRCNVYLRGAERIEPRKHRRTNVWRILAFLLLLAFVGLSCFTYKVLQKTNSTLI